MKKIKKKITIGRLHTNDYQLNVNHTKASRHHATLYIYEDCTMRIEDHSTNGTHVNKKPVGKNQIEVSRGDLVQFAGEENLDWSRIPECKQTKGLSLRLPFALLVLGLLGYLTYHFAFSDSRPKGSVQAVKEKYSSSVGLIVNAYFLKTDYGNRKLFIGFDKESYEEDQSLRKTWNENQDKLLPFFATGTGFLIDNQRVGDNANLVTNRHVAVPSWQINNKDYIDAQEEEFFEEINKLANDMERIFGLIENPNRQYETHPYILKFIPSNASFPLNKGDSYQSLLNRLSSSNSQIMRWSNDASIDIALLSTELNDDLYQISLEKDVNRDLSDVNVGDESTLLGYSGGISTNYQYESGTLDFQTSREQISKEPNEFELAYDIRTLGGSSGSPVFDEKGKLIAVHYAKDGAKGLGIPIKHLYDVLDFENVTKQVSNQKTQYAQ
jgi:S1-C subfamily serine protease